MIFAENARVAFIGDSITHSSPATSYIQEYYQKHFPKRKVKIFNLGTGGDTAEGAYLRLESDILLSNPTEAVIMLGTNDIGRALYVKPEQNEEERRDAEERCARHLAAIKALTYALTERNIPVTLCSSIGRDELTPKQNTELDSAFYKYGASACLKRLYDENCRALDSVLKAKVDYFTPFQRLQSELLAIGGPSLFSDDRTHASVIGQHMMARIFLRSQGLPVELPSAELIASGWCEAPLSPALEKRFALEQTLRNVRWVDPHQAKDTEGLDLDMRIAYWERAIEEGRGLARYGWAVPLYRSYIENVKKESEIVAELEAMTEALYN